jgi:predicted nucleotidyltransferase
MAKRKPTLTLLEMENELGYKVDTSIHPAETVKRFYSDLRPVPDGTYEKTEREFEEYKKMRYTKQDKTISEGKALRLAVAEVSIPLMATFVELK